jgi:uncharacterized SAM-binding protein YcdF (DUF218 family)
MSSWEITNTIALLLMPPGCVLVFCAAGLLLLRSRRRAGIALIVLSWVALYALSMPYLSGELLKSIEPPVSDPAADRSGDAIVVLGGGKYYAAPEYGGKDSLHPELVARLRYAAYLHRRIGKPLLLTGGSPRGDAVSEAEVMKQVLETEFNVSVRWVEQASRTTQENAALSYAAVHGQGVSKVYLVTHAWHMKRAQLSFERAGFTVIPAPTMYKTSGPRKIVDFLPDADALKGSSIFFHEVIGLAWYRLKFAFSGWSQLGTGVMS